MKYTKYILIAVGLSLCLGLTVFAAPPYSVFRTLLPEQSNLYDVGSPARVWANLYGGTYWGDGSNLTGITAGVATTSPFSAGYIPYATSGSAITNSNIFQLNGNIGIGTTTPNNLLQVYDLIKFKDADWSTNLGFQAGKYDLGQYNAYIGYQAGSAATSTGVTTAAAYNTGIGYRSLYSNTTGYENSAMGNEALLSNTTGRHNSAIGSYALRFNTSGRQNSAMGYFALRANVSGYSNSAMGYYALSNSTGGDNSAMGMEALIANTSGSRNSAMGMRALSSLAGAYHDNTALGYNAGRLQAGGTALTTPSQSVYIGSEARGFSNSDVNSIVIGYNAIGIGANSVVLGSDSIITTALKGNVGIGTTVPSSTLHIAGSIGCLTTSTATSTTVGSACLYVYTGSATSTFTLPTIASTNNREYRFKNRGSATTTITATSTNFIYSTATSTTYDLSAGSGVIIQNDGTYWDVLYGINN